MSSRVGEGHPLLLPRSCTPNGLSIALNLTRTGLAARLRIAQPAFGGSRGQIATTIVGGCSL